MIEATRIKTNDKDGCQVEASGSIGDLMMEIGRASCRERVSEAV